MNRRFVSMQSVPPCNCHFSMCLHETRNCLLNGSIVWPLLFVVAQIQKEHLWIVVIVPANLKSGQNTKGAETWSGRPAVVLLWLYIGLHNFPRVIPASQNSVCISSSLCCCSAMARQTDGAFSDFDPSEYSSIFSITTGCCAWGQHLVLVLLCRSFCHQFFLAVQVYLLKLCGKVPSCPGPTALAPRVPRQYQTQVSCCILFCISDCWRNLNLVWLNFVSWISDTTSCPVFPSCCDPFSKFRFSNNNNNVGLTSRTDSS